MTEADWLACRNPNDMLAYLAGRADVRRLRLFACACCRRLKRLLPERASRRAVRAAERYADGRLRASSLEEARHAAEQAWRRLSALEVGPAWDVTGGLRLWRAHARAAQAAVFAAAPYALEAAKRTSAALVRAGEEALALDFGWPRAVGWAAQADLLREIFGNPPRPAAVAPEVLHWHDRCVVHIARKVYDAGRFGDLPVLADALQDAGCDDEAILSHCRSTRGHVRGCWVVDLLLSGDAA